MSAAGVVLPLVLAAIWAAPLPAEQAASELRGLQHGYLDAGAVHTCALLDTGAVRCWGFGAEGRLGYANTNHVGDDESPGAVGPVNLGAGRTARALSAGGSHTCALLDTGAVRCWGHGASGRLGYANPSNVGDNEHPGAVGPVDLGEGRTARAISAGGSHTCALLDNGAVRCWGFGAEGQLGYANRNWVGDDESPGAVGPVNLRAGRTARAISAGSSHTCALLDTGAVRCWGHGAFGRLGYANSNDIGDDESPGAVGPVDLAGVLAAAAADLSLVMAADRAEAQVGEEVRLTVTAANAGPDPSGPVSVASPLPGRLELVSATASQGSYDPGTGTWAIVDLASGASATLELRARVAAAGAITAAAEVVSADPPDPDSVPANGAAEDDRGTARITATAPPAPPDPPDPPAPPDPPDSPAADTTPPAFTASFPARLGRAAFLRRGVSGRVQSNEPASFRFELLGRLRGTKIARAGDVVLAERSLRLGSGRRSVRLKVAKALGRRLGRRLRLTLRITATDTAGNRRTGTRRIAVR